MIILSGRITDLFYMKEIIKYCQKGALSDIFSLSILNLVCNRLFL